MLSKTPNNIEIEPFTIRELAVIHLAKRSFSFFLQQVYSLSFEGQKFTMAGGLEAPFTLGEVHYRWAQLVEENNRVCILAPRMHLKSTIMNHAFAMWQLFKAGGNRIRGVVVSFNDNLAREHTKQIKEVIRFNPYCRFWVDNKLTSESVVDFQIRWTPKDRGIHGTVDPYGIMSNLRGRHPNFLICDDILTDFKNALETTMIASINTIFNSSLSSLPNRTEPLIVIGTPQSYEDTLYMLKDNDNYVWGRFPAEKPDGTPLWPEKFDLERLAWQRHEVKETAYKVEYLLIPQLAVTAFLPYEVVEAAVDYQLVNYDLEKPFVNPNNWPVYGGMDLGKEVHPTHISVGILAPTGDIIQIYERFLDGVDYRTQARIITAVVNHFNIKRFYFDETRGEFSDRVMSKKVLGRKFTKKMKTGLALSMESRFYADDGEPRIILINDKRQVGQIVAVDKQLQSIDTMEGHGDAFWSVALMIRACEDGPVIQEIGNAQDVFGGRGRYRMPDPLSPAFNPQEAIRMFNAN